MRSYALVGASSRSLAYGLPLSNEYADRARLVGVFDPNPVRAQAVANLCGNPDVFTDFDAMLNTAQPDCVIITTVDRYHAEYIVRALEAGRDVITEKPMAIDAAGCRAILDAERRIGRKITVTFNYRFAPHSSRIRELMQGGIVGEVLSVDFEWFLDTRHGADYFRRWHRKLANSGGLLVHKATHHFDVINWWINQEPEVVYAFGQRRFYGPTREARGERCSTCPHAANCEFFVDYAANPLYKALYFDAEHVDGYHRDSCVFSPEIDIYDTMGVGVRYRDGALLSYSLIAHSSYEGWRATINGTEGRLELEEFQSGSRAAEADHFLNFYNRRGERITYATPKTEGVHGGGDERLMARLFSGQPLPDPLGLMADSWAGAMSVLIGAAANQSISAGRPVTIGELLTP